MVDVSLLAAFVAGVISFISPCVLPLVPGYISFVSGKSMEELGQGQESRRINATVILSSVAFVAGFSLVFVILGASATALGQFFSFRLSLFSKIAGVIIIIFGLHTMGVLKIKYLYRERRFHARRKPLGLLGSFVVGIAFAFGWTPCIGPILAAILTYAGIQESLRQGILLLAFYSLGLGLPFIGTALALNSFLNFFDSIKRHFRVVEVVAGVLLIVLGAMIYTNNLTRLISIFPDFIVNLQNYI